VGKGKAPLKSRNVDRTPEALDKKLNCIVGEMFARRPRKKPASVRPKGNGSLLQIYVGGKRRQRPTPIVYAFPSWRKKLKGQLPDNVSEATKLHPIKGARFACTNDAEIASGAHPRPPMVRSKPLLQHGRQSKGGSEVLPRGPREKRLVITFHVVGNNGLHEGKRRKYSGVFRAKGKGFTV